MTVKTIYEQLFESRGREPQTGRRPGSEGFFPPSGDRNIDKEARNRAMAILKYRNEAELRRLYLGERQALLQRRDGRKASRKERALQNRLDWAFQKWEEMESRLRDRDIERMEQDMDVVWEQEKRDARLDEKAADRSEIEASLEAALREAER